MQDDPSGPGRGRRRVRSRPMSVSPRLAVESLAARAAGRLSRLAGAGGGTTLPGKLLWKLDPGAIDALAARLPQGAAVVSATNGKTTTTRDGGGDSPAAAARLEPLRRKPRLRRRLHPAREPRRRARPARGRRGRAPRGLAPGPAAGRAARKPLPRPARPLRRARADRRAVALGGCRAAPRDGARGQRRRSPGRRARPEPRRQRSCSGSTTLRTRGPRSSMPPTRATASSADSRTSSPRPTSATSATTAAPRAATPVPHSRCARARSSCEGLDGVSFELETPAGSARIRLPLPGLYNVYNALGAAALAHALGAEPEAIRAGLERFGAAFGRFERIAVGEKSILVLLIKNPAGANEVVRTLEQSGAPSAPPRRPQRRDRRREGRLLDLGRRLRAAAREDGAPDRLRRPCRRARRPLRLRRPRRGRARGRARPRAGSRPRARADAARRGARRPPHLHRHARPAAALRRARARQALLGALVRIRVGHLYPEYLNIYADRGQHRGVRAPRRAARPRARGDGRSRSATTSRPASTTCSTSAAARIASRR